MFLEFLDFGAGLQRAGKGEHALAILSQDITQKGTGDIDVKGVPVELKVASTKGSGRLGEGGVSAERVKQTLMQFEAAYGKDRKVSVSKELSKKFEQPINGSLSSVRAHFESHKPKGEFVIILSGNSMK